MNRTPEMETTAIAGSTGGAPALPSAPVRVTIAFVSGVLGWLLASAAAFAFDRFMIQGGGSAAGDMLLFVLLIGLSAGGAWIVSVLPLVVFGDHGSWLFRPMTAPLVGGSCGVLLLALENWIFFDFSPRQLVDGGLDVSEAYLFALAAIVGAGTWTAYNTVIRRLERSPRRQE
jgi:hypothetical protein